MPLAAILALVEQYGPTAISLLSSAFKAWGAVAPLVTSSYQAGTLAQDVTSIVNSAEALAPTLSSVVGPMTSLSHVAQALQSVGPSAPVDPANPQSGQIDRNLGSHAR